MIRKISALLVAAALAVFVFAPGLAMASDYVCNAAGECADVPKGYEVRFVPKGAALSCVEVKGVQTKRPKFEGEDDSEPAPSCAEPGTLVVGPTPPCPVEF